MTTAIKIFLLKINLDFYETMCHISVNGTAFTHLPSAKRDHRRTQASFPGGFQWKSYTLYRHSDDLGAGADRDLVCSALAVMQYKNRLLSAISFELWTGACCSTKCAPTSGSWFTQ